MKKILIALMSVIIVSACDPLTDLNEDIKNPETVPASALFNNALVSLFDFMASPNVNVNNLRLWSQHWAQTTYPQESNYELVERNVNGRTWNRLYATVIADTKQAKIFTQEDEFLTDENKKTQAAIMEVIEVFAFHLLVDFFGDVPYSQALDSDNITPGYDNDADIYSDLITRLDAAIADLNGESNMDWELVYEGDSGKWKKFANSLKLRLAFRIADMDSDKAKNMAEAAVAGGVFESSSDDFELAFEGSTPNTNPLWVQLIESNRSDFVAANTFTDVLNALEDPRRSAFFKGNITEDSVRIDPMTMQPAEDDNGEDIIDTYPIYVGGTYGDANSFPANSQPGEMLEDPTLPGTIMDYTEVRFLLADAVERGYNVGGTAEEHYDAAVKNSIEEWGSTSDDADAYLAQADVAYSTAPGTWKEKIAMQKWIAMYNRGFEGWSTYRVYNAPTMNIAAGAGTTPPMRYTYPVTEYSLNGENVNAASGTIGGDDLFTKVFWDM